MLAELIIWHIFLLSSGQLLRRVGEPLSHLDQLDRLLLDRGAAHAQTIGNAALHAQRQNSDEAEEITAAENQSAAENRERKPPERRASAVSAVFRPPVCVNVRPQRENSKSPLADTFSTTDGHSSGSRRKSADAPQLGGSADVEKAAGAMEMALDGSSSFLASDVVSQMLATAERREPLPDNEDELECMYLP